MNKSVGCQSRASNGLYRDEPTATPWLKLGASLQRVNIVTGKCAFSRMTLKQASAEESREILSGQNPKILL